MRWLALQALRESLLPGEGLLSAGQHKPLFASLKGYSQASTERDSSGVEGRQQKEWQVRKSAGSSAMSSHTVSSEEIPIAIQTAEKQREDAEEKIQPEPIRLRVYHTLIF